MLGEVEEGGASEIGEDGWYLAVKRTAHLLMIEIDLVRFWQPFSRPQICAQERSSMCGSSPGSVKSQLKL